MRYVINSITVWNGSQFFGMEPHAKGCRLTRQQLDDLRLMLSTPSSVCFSYDEVPDYEPEDE